MNKKNMLVTGCTGFIGGVLVRRLLKEGWQVHALIRESSNVDSLNMLPGGCQFHVHDGSTEQLIEILSDVKPKVVFHLASLFLADHSFDQITGLINSNVLFSTQLVEAMVRTNCNRLINTGTSWQHYNKAEYSPVNLYAATKQAFDDILVYYHDAHELSIITLKLFDTYGLGDKRRKLIDILVDAAKSGCTLDVSPGQQIIDLTHVDDVVESFIIAEKLFDTNPLPFKRDYFISGERCTVKELVKMMQDVFGSGLQVNFGGRDYRIREVMVPVKSPPGQILDGWSRRIDLHSYLHTMAE